MLNFNSEDIMKKVEIKNLLYQPLPLLLSDGSSTSIKPRTRKKIAADKLVEAQIHNLVKKEFIKYKELS